ncbi:uncharacterized protein N7515_001115 [Penicillium bovifimosum]|uniref:GPI anchored protein n=1 Tax=Penicillium bovifimosum TaxID=126998 RepID=A0A9W9HGZ8_9EURO|nr:uncharacterized protein N7515_001115 [Penicillium bovifimosum]KAJ5146551.1 hypothetical protein N7515_001115 [Penicillium bovifimosum]
MRTQQLLPLCGLLLASNFAIASKLDHDDVPNSCWAACSSVVRVANSCDDRHERDSSEIQCICDWDEAKTQIPLCSACITQHQADRRNGTHRDQDPDHDHDHDHDDDDDDTDDDDDDNEALDLVRSCRFTTTTYNSAAATTLVGTSTATAASTEATTTDAFGAATSNTASATDSSSPNGANGQDSSSVTPSSSDSAGTSPGSASSPSPTPDAAAGASAPGAASMAGIMGLMALAWL